MRCLQWLQSCGQQRGANQHEAMVMQIFLCFRQKNIFKGDHKKTGIMESFQQDRRLATFQQDRFSCHVSNGSKVMMNKNNAVPINMKKWCCRFSGVFECAEHHWQLNIVVAHGQSILPREQAKNHDGGL